MVTTAKKFIVLDVDGCMYYGQKPDGTDSDYVAANRKATSSWASSLTGKTAEDLATYRKEHGAKVGYDRSLLDFIRLHTGRDVGIRDLAKHRGGAEGYKPEEYLESCERLVRCLEKVAAAGYTLVVVSDNPVAERTVRQLGILPTLIPSSMIFEPLRMGTFKDVEVLWRILKQLGATPADAAMFGDSPRSDIAPAEAIGMQAFLCVGPDVLVDQIYQYTGLNEPS